MDSGKVSIKSKALQLFLFAAKSNGVKRDAANLGRANCAVDLFLSRQAGLRCQPNRPFDPKLQILLTEMLRLANTSYLPKFAVI